MKVKSARAFSLVELLIVITILSILGTIAVPNFAKYRGNANLKEAAREISGDIKLCKQRAVAENIEYRILLSVANNTYTIQKETSPSNWENVYPTKKICEDDAHIKIIGNPTFAGDKIIFYTRGTTSAGTMEIQHEKMLSKISIVTSLMGRVKIKFDLK
ncbi:MAG: prepilin-type N-terminal cleavage/methylation domain-containing protein [Smithella sp.]|jgi:prepilin-type N-terminal cleavage/methylation domain-containing protein